MLAAQARMELRLSLRNGEQVLLTLLIPLLLTAVLVAEPFIQVDSGSRVDFVVPGVLALAVTSAAFTGLAIATGFERKYGVLKRLGATALPRSVLLLGKTGAVLCIELLQLVLVGGLGFAMGWRPTGGAGAALSTVLLVVIGTAAFAGLGLLLATLGIYGVISYSVTRQRPEIGVRMALGATAGRVQRQVLGETLRMTLVGVGLGTMVAFAVARAIASLLFATSPWDLPSYLGVAGALLLVAVISGYIPARRASLINPMEALRNN